MMESPSSSPPVSPDNREDTTAQEQATSVNVRESSDTHWSDSNDTETEAGLTTSGRGSRRPPLLDSRFSCNICFEAVTEPVVTQCGHLYCWPCLYRWLEPGIYPNEREGLLSGTNTGMPPAHAPVDESRRCCPVCKAECSIPTIVPIFVRNEPPSPQQHVRKQQRHGTQHQSDVQQDTTRQEDASDAPQEPLESVSTSGQDLPAADETSGLRRRLRFRSHDSDIPDVPSRPAPSSPQRRSNSPNPYNAPMPQQTHYRPPLSHGLAHSLWQSLSYTPGESSQQIPSLHQNRLAGGGQHPPPPYAVAQDDDATEFLWRLLLMLGSFVIFCLLIF